MITATPNVPWKKKRYFKRGNRCKMEAGAIFESILEQNLYEPDGRVKADFREFLRQAGRSEEEIAQYEQRKRQEIEERKLWDSGSSNLKEKIIAREGLDTEELLSQGYIAAEDLEFQPNIDSFNWEDLL
jgi:hypothetical protein